MRLRRVRVDGPGWTRRRAGRGFVYLDERGERIGDAEELARVVALVIPPAWREVWICPLPHGHVQATGTDDAGRRQYLYHPQWRARRDRLKHDHVIEVARRLPAARRAVRRALTADDDPFGREAVLALAFRLLDLGYFRAGGEAYAARNGSFGLATLRREHVLAPEPGEPGTVRFRYPAKSGQVREVAVTDRVVAERVRELVLRPVPGGRRAAGDGSAADEGSATGDEPATGDSSASGSNLLAWRDDDGAWHDVTSADVLAEVKARLGEDATAKDFRTWHATVLAAQGLAAAGDPPASDLARRRVVAAVVRDVADELGNTPAVCRASYVDPRVIDLWESGSTIAPTRSRTVAERRTLELLA